MKWKHFTFVQRKGEYKGHLLDWSNKDSSSCSDIASYICYKQQIIIKLSKNSDDNVFLNTWSISLLICSWKFQAINLPLFKQWKLVIRNILQLSEDGWDSKAKSKHQPLSHRPFMKHHVHDGILTQSRTGLCIEVPTSIKRGRIVMIE
mgnify:CR=1 FL=1